MRCRTLIDLRTQLFRTWFRLSRPMTLGVRGLVENADGKILLVRHTYVKGWFFPGGGVERGETLLQSLQRELAEEGGVNVTGVPTLLGLYSNHRVFRNDHVALYRVDMVGWEATEAKPGREIAEILWCDPTDLPAGITAGTQRRIEEYYRGAAVSEYW